MAASEQEEVWTIGRVLRWTQQRFAERGISSPRLDAELLLAHSLSDTLGGSRVALYTHFEQPLEKETLGRYRELIKRRLQGSPVAYLTGEKEFFGLPLKVSEAVLIPRPDTEILVEQALKLLPLREGGTAPSEPESQPVPMSEPASPGVELRVDYDEPEELPEPAEATDEISDETANESAGSAKTTAPKTPADVSTEAPRIVATVVEVGVGSGAVSLAIAHKRNDVRVIAIDKSQEALAVAQENAQRLKLPVEFHQGDLLAPLAKAVQCTLIVANLPYIPTAEIATLAPEVRSEPRLALDGGPDGLDIVRRLIEQAPAHLQPGGSLLLEIGDGQAEATEKLLRAAQFTEVRSVRDLGDIARVVIGKKPV